MDKENKKGNKVALIGVLLIVLIAGTFKYSEIKKLENEKKEILTKLEESIEKKDFVKTIEAYTLLEKRFSKSESKKYQENYNLALDQLKKESEEKLKIEIKRKEEELKLEKEKEKLEEKKRAEEIKKLVKIKNDEFTGITWYYNRYFTHYHNSNKVSIYFSKDNLRLKASFEGEDWLFFNTVYFSYDGNRKEINFDRYKNKGEDNGYGGRVWEWIDISLNDSDIIWLKELAKAKNSKVRFSGKDYSNDRSISENEKKAILQVIEGYETLHR